MDYKECCYVKRARSTQMAFQNRRAGLEIFHKKNIVRFAVFSRRVKTQQVDFLLEYVGFSKTSVSFLRPVRDPNQNRPSLLFFFFFRPLLVYSSSHPTGPYPSLRLARQPNRGHIVRSPNPDPWHLPTPLPLPLRLLVWSHFDAFLRAAPPILVSGYAMRKSGGKLIGKCLIPLQPLLTACELTVSAPILTEGRREAGGSVEMSLRLRKPISADEVVVTEVR